MTTTNAVYLIPIPICEGENNTLSVAIADVLLKVNYFFVEDLRTARRFLKSMHPSIIIDNLHFSEIDKHNGADINLLQQWLKKGYNVGIMSEAGCPGIADPGADLVAIAHKSGVRVVPLVGPNSIILALMASGLNGQSFCFVGYIPVKDPVVSKSIKDIELRSIKDAQTQIFIETPYRNDKLYTEILKSCCNTTRLCIAQNISSPLEFIKTKTIAEWKKETLVLGKLPTVFLLLG